MKEKKLYLLMLSAVFAAVCASLAGFIRIPNAIGGYIHPGEAAVYLCAAVLPCPYAALATATGFAIADLMGGYVYYMLPSALIRIIVVLLFTAKEKKIINRKNIIALPLSLIITVTGYFIFKFILYYFVQKTPEVALINAVSSIPGNIIQCLAGSVIFIIAGTSLDKIDFKGKFFGGNDNV